MTGSSYEKIDMFCHILPLKYKEALYKKAKPCYYLKANEAVPALSDLDTRFRVMDRHEGLRQVMTIGAPPLEYAVSGEHAVELAKMANDEMAELLDKHPDRFVAAVACLPMNDVDAALLETDRAINQLKFKGIQVYTPTNGKPLDRAEFLPLYEKMAGYNLPIWIHPARDNVVPDYADENESRYRLFVMFGWPYETTLAMGRLVFSGVLETFPNLKLIAHHCGAMIPFFSRRMLAAGQGISPCPARELTKPILEYFKKFFADTVVAGHTAALMCGLDFFGPDNLLFASDYPYPGGREKGELALDSVIKSVERMDVPPDEKEKIFWKNAKRIMNIPERQGK